MSISDSHARALIFMAQAYRKINTAVMLGQTHEQLMPRLDILQKAHRKLDEGTAALSDTRYSPNTRKELSEVAYDEATALVDPLPREA